MLGTGHSKDSIGLEVDRNGKRREFSHFGPVHPHPCEAG